MIGVAGFATGAGGCGVDRSALFTDSQAVRIADIGNQAAVDQANVALDRASGSTARALAQVEHDDHEALLAQIDAVAQQLGLAPAESQTSVSLGGEQDERTATLRATDAAAFDSEYLSQQEALHVRLRDLLHDTFSLDARPHALRDALSHMEDVVDAHLAAIRSARGETP